MISSVVARFESKKPIDSTLAAIKSRPELESGTLIDGRLLPITIDTNDHQASEEVTRWLQSLPGIAFVDVVYVHFESDEDERDFKTTKTQAEPRPPVHCEQTNVVSG